MRTCISDVIAALIAEGYDYAAVVRILGRLPPVEDFDTLPPESLETCPPLEIYTPTDCEALAETLPSAR